MTVEELIKDAQAADSVKDFKESFRLYKEAAEIGNVYAIQEIGSMYLLGRGVDKNLNESFKWIKKAAEKGLPVSMAMLAKFYEVGIGTTPDINEALKWYVEAAMQAKNMHNNAFRNFLKIEGR